MSTFKIAVVQTAPVFLDRGATVAKACALIAEAAQHGARLVVFPEAFVPTYPDWVWAIPPGQGALMGELYAELLAQAVTVPDAATGQLCQAAHQAGVYVVIGVNERNSEASNASLYNTLLFIDAQGALMGKHRKLVPTGPERMVWAPGDGSTLAVYDTPFARLGGLICWENYMPLARYAMYAWGVQLYLAPTWDRGQPWLSTLRHIAKEGRVYVVGCSIAMRKADLPDHWAFKAQYYAQAPEWINVGDSAVVDPEGRFIAGPLRQEQGILYAEIDPQQLRGPKWVLDVAGHYARPDVFQLTVHRVPRPCLRVAEGPTGEVPEPPSEVLS
ncbi:MAG: nitrilase [Candidatus Tectimicrobiota bacterium]|nr:MAG: nitrilase [Candidatus Tectomicrobia bacterium]